MPTQEKIEAVARLKGLLERSTMVVSTQYRGMTVKEMHDLRRKMREAGIDLKVVKNTLLRLASDQAGRAAIMDVVDGPTALALAYDDVIEAAKVVTAYAQSAPGAFQVRGGYLDGTVLTANDLRELTKIPPRPVLIAQFMGQMQAPLANFIALLDAPLQELTGLLQSLLSELPGLIEARAKQMESAA